MLRAYSSVPGMEEPEFVSGGVQIDGRVDTVLAAKVIAAKGLSSMERLARAVEHFHRILWMDERRRLRDAAKQGWRYYDW